MGSPSIHLSLLHNTLRIHDNPTLPPANTAKSFIPLYIITHAAPFTHTTVDAPIAKTRAKFILESLTELNNTMKDMGGGGVVALTTKGDYEATEDATESDAGESEA